MKAIKVILILLLLLVTVVIGGVAGFVALVDPNDFKTQIANKVLEETGRELSLDGNIEWAFWPKLTLKTGPLTLSNAAGFGDEPFFAADEIQIAVATLPLLKSQIEMDTVKLYGAQVNLAANADGVTNWADLSGESSDEKSSGDISAIALGGVDIRDARISWRDATSGQIVNIDKLNMTTGALTFGDPIAFEISLGALANKPALDSDIKLVGTVSYDLGEEKYRVEPLNLDVKMRGKSLPGGAATITTRAIVDVDLKEGLAHISQLKLVGLGTQLIGNIEATNIESATLGARGSVDLQGDDLALLFRAFELPIAKQIGKLKKRAFNFSTAFDADMSKGNVSIKKLVGNMLGANFNATLEAQHANTDKPAATGKLSAKGPDLPSLLAVFGQLQGMDKKTLNGLLKVLRSTKNKSFDVQSSFHADMQSGLVNLPTLDAKLLGNTISGTIKSTPSKGDKTALSGTLNAFGPDLPSLLAIAATFQGPDSGLHGMSKSLSSSPDKAFNLKSSFATDAGSGIIDLPQLTARGLGLVINGSIKGQNIDSDKGIINGRLTVNGAKLQPLLSALGQKDLGEFVNGLSIDAGINGTMANLTISPLNLLIKVKGAQMKKQVNVKLTIKTAQANLDKETLSLSGLSLTGLGMNINAEAEATKIKSTPAFSGKLNVPNLNLRKVLHSLNQKIPLMADAETLKSFKLNTDFSGSSESIALNNLAMKIDQSNLTGNISFADFETPDVGFNLVLDRFNADRYLAPKPKGKARPIMPEAAAAGAARLPVKTLRSLKINGQISVKKLTLSGAKMDDVFLKINAQGGKITLKPMSASLYQGKYNGAITLNAKEKVPALSLNSKLAGVDIESLLFDMTGNRSFSGIANIDGKLKAVGNNNTQLTNGLNGLLKFSVTDGVYRGIDVAAMLAQIEVMVESKRPSSISKGGETKFQSLSGTINFKNGVGKNSDLLLDGSGFKITGKGMVADLRTNKIKYDAKVSVDSGKAQRGESNYNVGGYTVPIRCRGEIGANACKPDVGDIIAEISKSAVKNEIGKQLEKIIGGDVGETLKKLFKF